MPVNYEEVRDTLDKVNKRIDAIWALRNSDAPLPQVLAAAINEALQARIETGRHG